MECPGGRIERWFMPLVPLAHPRLPAPLCSHRWEPLAVAYAPGREEHDRERGDPQALEFFLATLCTPNAGSSAAAGEILRKLRSGWPASPWWSAGIWLTGRAA